MHILKPSKFKSNKGNMAELLFLGKTLPIKKKKSSELRTKITNPDHQQEQDTSAHGNGLLK